MAHLYFNLGYGNATPQQESQVNYRDAQPENSFKNKQVSTNLPNFMRGQR